MSQFNPFLLEMVTDALDWWEENQYNAHGDRNDYDVEPDFVATAKKIWIREFSSVANDWTWIHENKSEITGFTLKNQHYDFGDVKFAYKIP